MSETDVLMSQWVPRKRPHREQYLPHEAPFNLGLAFQSKSWDASAPAGPYLITIDEDVDPLDLDFDFRVSAVLNQSGDTGDMVVTMHALISYLSKMARLEVGDVIFTGVPAISRRSTTGPDVPSHLETEQFMSKCVQHSDGD